MSSSASRVWTISGRPAVRAARDVGAEALLLPIARTVVVEIVEPGLAEADDLRMARRARRGARRSTPSSAAASCGWTPTVQKTLSKRSAIARTRSKRVRWVPMVSIVPTPAAAARAITASRSSAKSGKSRWQWLSTSIRTLRCLPAPRRSAERRRCGAGSDRPAGMASVGSQRGERALVLADRQLVEQPGRRASA